MGTAHFRLENNVHSVHSQLENILPSPCFYQIILNNLFCLLFIPLMANRRGNAGLPPPCLYAFRNPSGVLKGQFFALVSDDGSIKDW